MSDLQPYQQRVIDEKEALDTKISALNTFLLGVVFSTLPKTEQDRLTLQRQVMQVYSTILAQRISAF
jgi:hypothetical protein